MEIISRSRWGAKYRDGFGNRSLPAKHVFLHHSVTSSAGPNATEAQDAAKIRIVESVGYQRFGGIPYTYLITESGRIFQGHSPGRIGAHTSGYNTIGIGISFVGNYETLPFNGKQRAALIWLLQKLRKDGVLSSAAVLKGHFQVKSTACPGKNIRGLLTSLELESRGSVPPTPAPSNPLLKEGMKGEAVIRMQKKLLEHGMNLGKYGADGSFGPTTKAAVITFQKLKKLTVDGIVGDKTWAALYTAPVKPVPSTPVTVPTPTPPKPDPSLPMLRQGAKGALVRTLQAQLNKFGYKLVVDGDFGPKTNTAVRAFQAAKRLVVDGIVGPKTWQALNVTVSVPAPTILGTVVAKSGLRVRKGPGLNFGILGALRDRTRVTILSKGKDWHKIKYGNSFGYVSAKYVRL